MSRHYLICHNISSDSI